MHPNALSVAKRSYPTSEVRDSSQECQAATAQEPLRGATQVQGQGWRPGGATPRPRTGAAGRSHPMPEARGGGQRGNPRSGDCAGAGGPREAIPR